MVSVIAKAQPKDTSVPARILTRVAELLTGTSRVFGTPGASLTGGIEGSASSDVSAGAEGEKQTAKILAQYVTTRDDVRVFHSIRWPGSKGDTDHILVCGNHVIIIDSKRWMAKRKYSVTAKGSIIRGTVPFKEGKVKMIPSLKAWREQLPVGTKVTGVVCIAQQQVFVPYDKYWYKSPFKLVTAEKLTEFLDTHLEKQKEDSVGYLDVNVIAPIITNLIKARDRRSELINVKAMSR